MSRDPASPARFAVGIDLGTTHCALSVVDVEASDGEDVAITAEPIPQTVSPGEVQTLPLLPSFVYLPHANELEPGATALPWSATPAQLVGELARARGAQTPTRLVSSAKSWLCHPGADRRAPILPPGAPEDVACISPLDASVFYLRHLRAAFDDARPDTPLHTQDVTITVPASFDPAARELTAEAARLAGIEQFTLLEEPQAAVYSWIASQAKRRDALHVNDVLLVVDVGGGTTDLSLIAVRDREGDLELHRVAVGEHILLGGDNMDLALAHVVKAKLAAEGKRLDLWQLRALTYACRVAKETLLAADDDGRDAVDAVPIVVPSRGSKLIGGSLRTELTLDEVRQVILEGFVPVVDAGARPATRARGALTELGLPYAQDAAVTRHLAAFLGRQVDATAGLEDFDSAQPEGATYLHPTAVLFNGGVLKAPALASRLLEVLGGWAEAEGGEPPRLLEGADLDRAVARGAAYYGYVRAGGGVRIRGGLAQSYYVGVESAMPAVPGLEPPVTALCVAPFGMEEGTEAAPAPHPLGLVVGEPVRFRFFGSPTRRDDEVGVTLEDWSDDELIELGAIEATLPEDGHARGEVVPVLLRSAVTEVGTLELTALPVSGDGKREWKVSLDVRDKG